MPLHFAQMPGPLEMPTPRGPFHAELSASPQLAEPVAGFVARFDLADGRQVDVEVSKATSCVAKACDTTGFRIVVRRANGRAAAQLSAMDLVDVFGARSASLALAAYEAGDLPRARRLAREAGAPWRGLRRLLREVSRRRSG